MERGSRKSEGHGLPLLLESVIKQMPVGVVLVEAPSGEVIFCNDQVAPVFCRAFLSADDIRSVEYHLYRGDGEPYRPEDWPLTRALWSGEVVDGEEVYFSRRDGSCGAVQVNSAPVHDGEGRVVAAVATLSDISERKRTEESLSRLAAIVESSDDAIISKSLDGTIMSWNRGAEQLYGYRAAEAIGKSITMLSPPERRNEIAELLAKLRRGERIDHYETVRVRKDGRRLDISLSIAPLRDASGRIVGAATIARDITRLKELDALKDQFISVAAHELKTPVAIMKGYAQMLLRGKDLPAARRRTLEGINRGADRIDRIVRDLLDISRLNTGEVALAVECVDLDALVAEVVERLARTTTQHQLRVASAAQAVVRGDRDRLEQVLANLLDNAIRYSPAGGAVDVALTVRDGEAVVAVHDHGIGIPKDKQGRMFERFYRPHSGTPYDYAGMGVGLYISKEIVARHGGRMWFESEEGKGSSFHFALPLKAGAMEKGCA